ncbi:YbjN domain-containing protein [Litorimonas sp. RW-G-Af-16]|uniref:YbjN domain-containing protein n=1 Tax=Litorimonas sp. RW-G-Af-16 TaxID=3241168 RepID=UPI00390C5FB3
MSFADQRCLRPNPTLSGTPAMRGNPINAFERLAIAEGYDFERIDYSEIHLSVPGAWCDHDISMTWNPGTEQVQVFLVFEGRTPGGRSDDICRLMSLINERLSGGHFDFWEKNQALVYRNALSLRGGATLRTEQAMDLIALALDAAERGYPACQYVIWAGKSPEDALTSALVDLASNP